MLIYDWQNEKLDCRDIYYLKASYDCEYLEDFDIYDGFQNTQNYLHEN